MRLNANAVSGDGGRKQDSRKKRGDLPIPCLKPLAKGLKAMQDITISKDHQCCHLSNASPAIWVSLCLIDLD